MADQREVMRLQWHEMHEQDITLQEQLGEMRRLANATAFSAEAAKRSAESMREAVVVQQGQMRQWLELKNWRWETIHTNSDDLQKIQIAVDITNPTSWPIDLDIVALQVGGTPTSSADGTGNLLPPKAQHTSTIDYQFNSESDLTNFASDTLLLQVEIRIVYRTALEKKRGQKMTTLLYGGVGSILKTDQWENVEWDSTPSNEKG